MKDNLNDFPDAGELYQEKERKKQLAEAKERALYLEYEEELRDSIIKDLTSKAEYGTITYMNTFTDYDELEEILKEHSQPHSGNTSYDMIYGQVWNGWKARWVFEHQTQFREKGYAVVDEYGYNIDQNTYLPSGVCLLWGY